MPDARQLRACDPARIVDGDGVECACAKAQGLSSEGLNQLY
jgi:hypothetical protein